MAYRVIPAHVFKRLTNNPKQGIKYKHMNQRDLQEEVLI